MAESVETSSSAHWEKRTKLKVENKTARSCGNHGACAHHRNTLMSPLRALRHTGQCCRTCKGRSGKCVGRMSCKPAALPFIPDSACNWHEFCLTKCNEHTRT